MGAEPRRRLRFLASIRARATLGAMVVVAVVLTVGAFLQIRAVERHLIDAAETSAGSRAIDVAQQARTSELPSTLVVADDDSQFVQVVNASGRAIAASDNVETRRAVVDLDPESPEDDDSEDGPGDVEYDPDAATFSDVPIDDGGRWTVVAVQVPTDAGSVTVYAGSSLEDVESTLSTLRGSLLVAVPVLVLIVGLVTLAVIRRALKPVDVMRAELDEITTRRLDHRIAEPRSDDEIAGLAQSMNDLLERMEASVTRERRFIGDASHELRSPLAALRTQLEVALAHPDRTDWVDTVRNTLGDTERIEALASDLLMLAQVDAATPMDPQTLIDLSELVADEIEHRPRPKSAQLRTVLEPDVVVRGHANQLTRVLRNLLDNAGRHAATEVTVRVGRTDQSAFLEVADDGPGIPAADRDRVFERFTRLDEARNRDAGGSGLGLAIVREVAVAHGGAVDISGPPGATFVVRLPLIPRH